MFSGSLCDTFEDHPVANQTRPRLWDLIRQTSHLDWLLLTKRPERIAANLPADWNKGYSNVRLGTSVENQANADPRIVEGMLATTGPHGPDASGEVGGGGEITR